MEGIRAGICLALILAVLPIGPAAQGPSGPDAQRVLDAARAALGGESRLAAIKTFVATGRLRQVRGGNLVPVEFEISCELPDKFVRRDEFPAQDADVSVTGFIKDALIQTPARQSERGPSGAAMQASQRLIAVKQDFARLMLGAFAASFSSYPLTFTYGATGEAPEGKADILNVEGPDQFSAQLVIQRDTSLPVIVLWRGPAAGGTAPSGAGGPVEQRLYYGDFREVSGVKWPFRIRRAVGSETLEEITFDRIRFNAKIDPKKFEAPK